jgi:hypothetical protein
MISGARHAVPFFVTPELDPRIHSSISNPEILSLCRGGLVVNYFRNPRSAIRNRLAFPLSHFLTLWRNLLSVPFVVHIFACIRVIRGLIIFSRPFLSRFSKQVGSKIMVFVCFVYFVVK